MSNDVQSKTHSKDYLLEYSERDELPLWLKHLVTKVVDAKGKLDNSETDGIYQKLLSEYSIDDNSNTDSVQVVKNNGATSSKSDKDSLVLTNITHSGGVNALALNESLDLSDSCTIIYGLNGTGKSGYFRILHELAGGNEKRQILDNIYNQGNQFKVDISYKLGSQAENSFTWVDKNQRGVYPFSKIKVFDSEYLPIFLNERESIVNLEPLGLNLFRVIVDTIDDFKDRLSRLEDDTTEKISDLETLIELIHSEELKQLLEKDELNEDEQEIINQIIKSTDDETESLAALKTQQKNLEKDDSESTQKLITSQKKELGDLVIDLKNSKKTIEELTIEISDAVKDYNKKYTLRKERLRQLEVLKSVPVRDSEEWNDFIESANNYRNEIDSNEDDFDDTTHCIYCHQALSEDALKLISAYSTYLDDQSSTNLKIALAKIQELESKLGEFEYEFQLSEELQIELEKKYDTEEITKFTVLSEIQKKLKSHKEKLNKALKDKKELSDDFKIDINILTVYLVGLSNGKEKQLNALKKKGEDRITELTELIKKIEETEDANLIRKWKDKIDNYFFNSAKAKKYKTIRQNLSTTSITNLGSKAHEELLTESIRNSFEQELKDLGKDIEVKLVKKSAGKGKVITSLEILGNDVTSVLSEGEQKAVALALFIAEINSQGIKTPVVFDDPVTSVDHEVADFLARKLLNLSKERQVIIFTHNKLFYDSLTFWSNALKDNKDTKTHHLCKNYGNGNKCKDGCHVYTYKVDRESKDTTGRIFKTQNESCLFYLEKAETELKRDEYTVSTVSAHLKSAIEFFIDEKVFNNQGLIKDHKRKDHIEWEMLKGLNPNPQILDQLRSYWDELSIRGTHRSSQSNENPMKLEDFQNIINYLRTNL